MKKTKKPTIKITNRILNGFLLKHKAKTKYIKACRKGNTVEEWKEWGERTTSKGEYQTMMISSFASNKLSEEERTYFRTLFAKYSEYHKNYLKKLYY